jgi:hypothetical protein
VQRSDVPADCPGELRLELSREASGAVPGSKSLARAGIFVSHLIAWIETHNESVFKTFRLYGKDKLGKNTECGSILLKVSWQAPGLVDCDTPSNPNLREEVKADDVEDHPLEAEEPTPSGCLITIPAFLLCGFPLYIPGLVKVGA